MSEVGSVLVVRVTSTGVRVLALSCLQRRGIKGTQDLNLETCRDLKWLSPPCSLHWILILKVVLIIRAE